MALGGRPHAVTLTDNVATPIQASPGTGKCILVLHIEVDNDQAVKTTVSIKEGTTTAYNVVCAPNGGGGPVDLGSAGGWILPEATALNAQQSVSGTPTYITALTRVIPAQALQS